MAHKLRQKLTASDPGHPFPTAPHSDCTPRTVPLSTFSFWFSEPKCTEDVDESGVVGLASLILSFPFAVCCCRGVTPNPKRAASPSPSPSPSRRFDPLRAKEIGSACVSAPSVQGSK